MCHSSRGRATVVLAELERVQPRMTDRDKREQAEDDGVTLATVTAVLDSEPDADEPKEFVGRSPMQLAWIRLKRDRVAMVSAWILVSIIALAYLSPVIAIFYGSDASKQHPDLLDDRGVPLGVLGGITGDHWLGITPRLGQDVLMQILEGIRTSVSIAGVSAVAAVGFGAIVGAAAGYFGGKIDAVISWIIDVFLSFPFLIFALVSAPIITVAFMGEMTQRPFWLAASTIFTVFLVFGWMSPARLVRGQVLSLREREFVEAAKASGAGHSHIIFKQLIPNVWAQILVTFSLLVPSFIVAEAALAYLGVGVGQPHADLGRLGAAAVNNMRAPGGWFLLLLSGLSLFVLVLTFNLFGDAVRDALNPKSNR